ncbi:T9SS type A sorting domain-containing protein [Lacinutrix jangbogonensis]|uniref:T9SS type A sorting domain-containing protein n=1 Tax=Lacinutrix jangbogonensis TaxID=1469557 RepID=UPI00053E8BF6|nr:T9SS type A sorting domain-containing protein [Lacinutrix jangbogonensis]
MKKITLLCLAFITFAFTLQVNAQCTTNSNLYPSSAVTPDAAGASTQINGCNYLEEYSNITGITAASNYQFTVTESGYITVEQNGMVLGHGVSSVTITAATASDIVVYWNVDGSCATAASCVVTTVQCMSCLLCAPPTATFTVNEDCVLGYNVDIFVTDMGDATSYDVSDGISVLATISAVGTTNVGPFANNEITSITLVHSGLDPICNLSATVNNAVTCPILATVDCATPISDSYCYDSNNIDIYEYTSTDGSPLTFTVTSGGVEDTYDELIVYDTDGITELYNGYGVSGDIAGLTFTSTGDTISWIIASDGSVSCAQNSACCAVGMYFTVECAAAAPANDDCANATPIMLGTEFSGDTSTSTDSGIGTSSCGSTGGDQDIWYSFVAPVSTLVSLVATVDYVVIYDGCGGNEVACLANGEQSVALTAGNTYLARLYNSGVASKVAGPFTATLSEASLSTQDFNNELGFSYYPNPVKNTLTLNAQQAITNVAVFNMLGQEVIRAVPNAVSNDVDMSNLQSGAYFVQVTVGAVVETVRVIKN